MMNNFDINTIKAYGLISGQQDLIVPILPPTSGAGPRGPTGVGGQTGPTGPAATGPTGATPPTIVGPTGARGQQPQKGAGFYLEQDTTLLGTAFSEELFTIATAWTDFEDQFVFEGGRITFDARSRPRYMVIGCKVNISGFDDIVQDVFVDISIDNNIAQIFGATTIDPQDQPQKLVATCCTIIELTGVGDIIFSITAVDADAAFLEVDATAFGFFVN